MNQESTYTGSKIRNHFTAYLVSQVRGRRNKYLQKKICVNDMEELTEDFSLAQYKTTVEEDADIRVKENLLLKEAEWIYPEWDEMSDKKLIEAMQMLREDERKLIYQYVFEERSFEEMSHLNDMTYQKVKNVYYYALQKIRRFMENSCT